MANHKGHNALWKMPQRVVKMSLRVAVLTNQNTGFLQRVAKAKRTTRCEFSDNTLRVSHDALPSTYNVFFHNKIICPIFFKVVKIKIKKP